MGEKTKIEWCDHTANIWTGCNRVHAGCLNCYAEKMAKRNTDVFGTWGPQGTRVAHPKALDDVRRWDRKAAKDGVTRRVFWNDMGDAFEDWPGTIWQVDGSQALIKTASGLVPATMGHLRHSMYHCIDECQNLVHILCTKRPENIGRMWVGHDCDQCSRKPQHDDGSGLCAWRACAETGSCDGRLVPKFRSNVLLLYSASDQETLEAGLPHLLECRDLVPVLGLSLEPLVGPVDLGVAHMKSCPHAGAGKHMCDAVDWVIVGGESGPNARPCNIEWIRDIVRQCRDAGVPCFVKQLGARPYMDGSGGERFDWPCGYTVTHGQTWLDLVDKKGGDPDEWPEDLRVREFPK